MHTVAAEYFFVARERLFTLLESMTYTQLKVADPESARSMLILLFVQNPTDRANARKRSMKHCKKRLQDNWRYSAIFCSVE